ncbi:hypothetical protein PRMUPPPA20_20870 [Xylanibacter ruminicola]|uniref:Uncharacterized protein n=1 Tax=Xylanibacter ruminicola TaxID=839 RepID=A0AA37MFW7_XYLRU|nr:hypothetical protein [Xylanibacter ruminicola]GJG33978.1 hypothetical protein PRMUPPPA20_20870 [Xylanibacter ruminicola]SEH65352.1 hypothetical protein SAMN02745192_0646 [Xylanibacter ruminicola]
MRIADKHYFIETVANNCERCLISPENPFTLDNPDLIAANGSKLFAVYVQSYKEGENIDYLLRRLFLSQLSYGYKLIPILVLIKEVPAKVDSKILENSFCHISDTANDVVRYISVESPVVKRMKDFSKIQSMQYVNYRNRLELSVKSYSEIGKVAAFDNRNIVRKVETVSWSTQNRRSNNNYWQTQGGFVGVAERKSSISFKSSLDSLMTLAFMSMFHLDDGRLYPTAMFDELSVLNTDWTMFDADMVPNSYNRMLSFVGMAPISISTQQQLWQVFDKYQNIRNHVAR